MAGPTPHTKRVTVPGSLALACDQFNAGQFFECHETIEEVWLEEQGAVRDCYKGLIQLAAAFVHVTRGNERGALRLLATALGYLDRYRRDGALGFDVEALARAAAAARAEIVARGVDAVRAPVPLRFAFDPVLLRAHASRDAAWGFAPGGTPLEMAIEVTE